MLEVVSKKSYTGKVRYLSANDHVAPFPSKSPDGLTHHDLGLPTRIATSSRSAKVVKKDLPALTSLRCQKSSLRTDRPGSCRRRWPLSRSTRQLGPGALVHFSKDRTIFNMSTKAGRSVEFSKNSSSQITNSKRKQYSRQPTAKTNHGDVKSRVADSPIQHLLVFVWPSHLQ